MRGYVKLHRSFIDSEWYSDINVSRLFIHLLIKANYKEKTWQGILIEKGSLITSISKLSFETKLSVKQIREAINKLKRANQVATRSTSRYTVIYIRNYIKYQEEDTQDGMKRASQVASERAITKEDKKIRNKEEEKKKERKKEKVAPPIVSIYQHFIEYWNMEALEGIPRATRLNDPRKNKIKSRLKSNPDFFNDFKLVVQKFKVNPNYYTGKNKINWVVNFDWVIKNDSNYLKVIEGNYDEKAVEKLSFHHGKLIENEKPGMQKTYDEALEIMEKLKVLK